MQSVVPVRYTVIKNKSAIFKLLGILNDNLTHMFKVLPFAIFRVRTLHTMNVTVPVLFKNKPFTNEGNENTMFMTNNCMKNFFSKLALLCSILDIVLVIFLVRVPVDMHLFPSSTPISLRSILGQVTLVAYLILGLSCCLISFE